jgi:hypothetical protein
MSHAFSASPLFTPIFAAAAFSLRHFFLSMIRFSPPTFFSMLFDYFSIVF